MTEASGRLAEVASDAVACSSDFCDEWESSKTYAFVDNGDIQSLITTTIVMTETSTNVLSVNTQETQLQV